MSKYDWIGLEKEYILSDYKSVKEFLRKKNIACNGNTNKQTKGWNEKRAIKGQQKSNKVVEKVIEKQSEKEAKQIVDLKSIANDLALNLIKANTELNRHLAVNKTKTKIVEYDKDTHKPSKEIIQESNVVTDYVSIVDRAGLKQLTSALKDLNDVIADKEDNNKQSLAEAIQNAYENKAGGK